MRSAITVCLVAQAKTGPVVFHEGLADACQRAADLGFDAIEIFPPAPGAVDTAELQGLLDHHGLKVAAFGTGAGWLLHQYSLTSKDPEVRKKARDFIEATIELSGGFGAPTIIGSMQGRLDAEVSRDQALAWLAESLEELGALAGEHHTTVLYEPLNRYETNLFNRVADTADWLGKLRTKNVRILADLFHMAIEERSIADALRHAGSAIGHVHFADSNRHAVGFGHSDLAPAIAALREIGYQGYLSAEVLPLSDSASAAQQTITSFRKLTHA
jgi:sugar phosphate isomerase/epimerase